MSVAAAESAIRLLMDAIDAVSLEQARVGTFENRMEHWLNFNMILGENQVAGLSRIWDLDFAREMMDFIKEQILLQVSTAMFVHHSFVHHSSILRQNTLGVLESLQISD